MSETYLHLCKVSRCHPDAWILKAKIVFTSSPSTVALQALDVEESGMGGNEVLQYMRTHGQSQAAQIRPGPEVREAMDVFLQRLLGTDSSKELASMVSETSLKELSRLLLWVMIVGYTLRSMEVRFSMGRAYALPYVALEDKGSRDNFDKL